MYASATAAYRSMPKIKVVFTEIPAQIAPRIELRHSTVAGILIITF